MQYVHTEYIRVAMELRKQQISRINFQVFRPPSQLLMWIMAFPNCCEKISNWLLITISYGLVFSSGDWLLSIDSSMEWPTLNLPHKPSSQRKNIRLKIKIYIAWQITKFKEPRFPGTKVVIRNVLATSFHSYINFIYHTTSDILLNTAQTFLNSSVSVNSIVNQQNQSRQRLRI